MGKVLGFRISDKNQEELSSKLKLKLTDDYEDIDDIDALIAFCSTGAGLLAGWRYEGLMLEMINLLLANSSIEGTKVVRRWLWNLHKPKIERDEDVRKETYAQYYKKDD